MKTVVLVSTILIALLAVSCGARKNQTIFTIGSGSKDAMYYPVAKALCEVFNKHNQDKNVVCEARLSKGAEYNLDAVESGEFDMGIAQANLQYDAYTGNKKFSDKPHKNLRTLFNVHDEYLTIIAKKDAHIKSFADLRGKKVNIGNPGSGSRILFSQMIKKLGWSLDDFQEVYEESGSNINKVLCLSNKADAAVYLVGHPNKSFGSMLDSCDAELVSLSEKEITNFVSLSPAEFHKSAIPAGTYAKNLKKVNTFASRTILTASAKLDKKLVWNFFEIISKNKEELVKIQPSLAVINFSKKDHSSLAPLHEGLKNIQ
jgi:TRAP transporter TAXI family solute receptor